jgi:hypothetical protein
MLCTEQNESPPFIMAFTTSLLRLGIALGLCQADRDRRALQLAAIAWTVSEVCREGPGEFRS